VAVDAIAASQSRVDEVKLVALDQEAYEEIDRMLARSTPLRILQGVRVLHQRGYQGIRVLPGMSASGMYWRVAVTAAENLGHTGWYPTLRDWDRAITYSTGAGTQFAGATVAVTSSPEDVADLILYAMPALQTAHLDPEYARWYDTLLELVERHDALPIAYADYFDDSRGWEIGWGSGVRHQHPPGPSC